ncbi:MAG: DUF2961 domain-containing protein [Haliscomenobacter sp.]|nr:DUF2961 domain-containing protein [Haliscomenobacter sp.]
MKTQPLLFVLLLAAMDGISQPQNAPEIKTGFEAMHHIRQLPLLFPSGAETKQPLAYDATGGNWDHHFLAAFTKYIDTLRQPDGSEIREYVIFDEYGPGCLFRQQMNAWFDRSGIPNGWLPVGELTQPRADANIRYYFDDEKEPRIDMHLKDFFGGKIAPFDGPLCFIDSLNLFAISYYPFPFQKRLKITMRPNSESFEQMDTKWYQYTHLIYPADYQITTWQGPQTPSKAVRDQWQKTGENPNDLTGAKWMQSKQEIKTNQTKTLFEIDKPGSIAGLRISLQPYTKETFYNTYIKMYWDGSKEAAVDLPLCYLFGGGAKDYASSSDKVFEKSLTTLLFGFDNQTGSFYSYFPMPFWKSAKIVLENKSGIDITNLVCDVTYIPASHLNYPADKTGYFFATRTTDADPDTTAYHNIAFEAQGRGHVAGIVFYSDKYDMDGDEFTYIDGSHNPQIHGSGTEDDHNQGWAGRAYQKPLWGGLFNGYNGAYRIYLNDCYIFNQNIRIAYEHSLTKKHFINGGNTDVVIFYYLSKNGSNLFLTDEVDVGNHFSESLHQYAIQNQTWKGHVVDSYDGYERNLDYATYSDDGKAFNGSSRFTVRIDPQNQGVRLRKRMNRRDNGVQSAAVYADGVLVKERPWHIVTPSLSTGKGDLDGWFDSDFNIPVQYTQGKPRITVEIKYIGSPKKEINEFYYWIYSYK